MTKFRKMFLPVVMGLSPLVLSAGIAVDVRASEASPEEIVEDQKARQQGPRIAAAQEMTTAWNEQKWSKAGDLFTRNAGRGI